MSGYSTSTYAKKYFVSDEIEFVTERDLEFDIEYKIPEDILSLVVDDLIVSNRIGIGTTQPQQRLDVAGSVKIDANIYDSINVPGKNGYQLARDERGIRWIPLIAESRPEVPGISTDGIFVLDEGVPLYP